MVKKILIPSSNLSWLQQVREQGYVLVMVIILVGIMSALVECLARQVSMEYQRIANLQAATPCSEQKI